MNIQRKRNLLLLVSVGVAAVTVIAACGNDDEGDSMPKPTATAAAMAKPDDAMQKPADAMEKPGDTMQKPADAMNKDTMTKDGDGTKNGDAMMVKVPDKIVAPHFVDSVPNHGDVLPQAPNAVTINFNFNLHADSALTVTRDGQPVTLGAKTIAANQLSMSAPVTGGTGDGVYTVSYKACWPDRSCHNGSVSFVVDAAKKAAFMDMRNKAEVAVPLQNIAFMPAQIIVSPGTRVTWTNNDGVTHFVNTDPHPSHNGLASLNSSSLEKGQTYAHTFVSPGIYGYHCSAHTDMRGQVLVAT